MLLVVLLFIILLIVFTADKEGGGGGGGLQQFDILNLIMSASAICPEPYDQDSTQVIDTYNCIFISADSLSYCFLESNTSCSYNIVHTYSNQFDSILCETFEDPFVGPVNQCGFNESQTFGDSISALAYIHNKYPELASYVNMTPIGMNRSLMSRP